MRKMLFLALALAMALYHAVCGAEDSGMKIRLKVGDTIVRATMEDQTKKGHLTTNDYVRDIVNHQAFKGFGEIMLPWDDNTNYYDTRLNQVGSLMPYHSRVNPDIVVDTLNHMIDEVNAGKTIFYDFYTERQKQEDPAKNSTGLFFH
jgi:hypothetical protein